jgi:Domain of unknown function (DUF4249)
MMSNFPPLNSAFFMHKRIISCILFLISLISLSCNKPFQPEVAYRPELNVYSVLFSNAHDVFVRVASVAESPSGVSQALHGASVKLIGTGPNDSRVETVALTDTTTLIDGVAASFYYAAVRIIPGGTYSVSVTQDGYPPVVATAHIPSGYATIPDQNTYSILQKPKNVNTEINLTVNVSGLASAGFVRMLVECRGVDSSGHFIVQNFNVFPVDSLNPFIELGGASFPLRVDTAQYQNAFLLASDYAGKLRRSHLYADVIVTQIDNSLYRFFITSNMTGDPLLMRTDKIIFSNVFNNAGTGVVAGAAIDTTRIFLF